MNLITRNTDYALRALLLIAKKDKEIVSVRDLVKELRIPRPFLRGILQKLNNKGILKSYKGKGGGFELARPTKKISVLDLMNIFQGEVKLQKHLCRKGICQNIKRCTLKKRLDAIEKYIISKLDHLSIASLAKDI